MAQLRGGAAPLNDAGRWDKVPEDPPSRAARDELLGQFRGSAYRKGRQQKIH